MSQRGYGSSDPTCDRVASTRRDWLTSTGFLFCHPFTTLSQGEWRLLSRQVQRRGGTGMSEVVSVALTRTELVALRETIELTPVFEGRTEARDAIQSVLRTSVS